MLNKQKNNKKALVFQILLLEVEKKKLQCVLKKKIHIYILYFTGKLVWCLDHQQNWKWGKKIGFSQRGGVALIPSTSRSDGKIDFQVDFLSFLLLLFMPYVCLYVEITNKDWSEGNKQHRGKIRGVYISQQVKKKLCLNPKRHQNHWKLRRVGPQRGQKTDPIWNNFTADCY